MRLAWMPALALLALPLASWSAGKNEQHVTMDKLPAAVKAIIAKERAGGQVEEVVKETEDGETFYEAEIVKHGKESYIHVSEDGKVLKRETAAQERKAEGREKEEHE